MKKNHLKEAMLEKYRQFIRWFSNQTMTAEEIEEQNPELLKDIHGAIEVMDSCFVKENFQGFLGGMKRVKNLYFEAVHKNIERRNEQ